MSKHPPFRTSSDSYPTFFDRVFGCWLGKSIGGTLGLPAEGLIGPLTYTYYDPIPTKAPPNDDLELQLVWLHLLEARGFNLTQRDFADAWLEHIHYMWDEYGRCRWNLRRGVPPSAAGTFENWFVSGMGSPIRSEIWACLCPGEPRAAACYAALDASLDHGPEGVAGEVFLASLQSRLLGGGALLPSLSDALADIDLETEVSAAIRLAAEAHADGIPTWVAYNSILSDHHHDNFTHAPLNLGLIAWALLYGEGDFERSLLLGTNCGYDTDCTAATVGATMGMLLGPEAIAQKWKDPIGEGIYCGPGIQGIQAPKTLAELSRRIDRLCRRRREEATPLPDCPAEREAVQLSTLPGTIYLHPLDGSDPVPWANGGLPPEVLAAGGAEWDWRPGPETRDGAWIVALAREGARLLLDGEMITECPPGHPFVPRVHLQLIGTYRKVTPSKCQHRMRLELASRCLRQEVEVILAGPSLHLAAWDGTSLPYFPNMAEEAIRGLAGA